MFQRLSDIIEVTFPLAASYPDTSYLELGADSLDLVGIAENVSVALSLRVTSMTLLEHCSFGSLSQHLAQSTTENFNSLTLETLNKIFTAVLDIKFPQSIV